MTTLTKFILAAALAVPAMSAATANEADFLQELSGSWSGEGEVRLRPTSNPMGVSCSLDSQANGTALSMDGSCSAMAIFSRQIGAELAADGSSYTGTYIGSARGPAELAGSRSGDTIRLALQWPDGGSGEGPRAASMQVEALGEDRMRLVTVEEHPETGEEVVTAQIDFTRR